MLPAKVLIADDHTLMRNGLRQLCEHFGGFTVVAEAQNGDEALSLAHALQPDLILMDIVMPGLGGADAISRIMRQSPGSRIIALTMYHEEHYMLEAIRAGARGYLLKTIDAAELIAAMRAVRRGDYLIDPVIAKRVLSELHIAPANHIAAEPLTDGEMAVLRLVARGVDNQQIATELRFSVNTVANRLRSIFQKLSVSNRTQAALYALRQGWACLDIPPA